MMRTHVLEILDRVTVAYQWAAFVAKEGIISDGVLLSFTFFQVGGRQLSWPQDFLGDTDLVQSSSWSEENGFDIRRFVNAANLLASWRAVALDTCTAIYSKFGWINPPVDRLRSEQAARFGNFMP
jgi:hypothetical protein